MEEKLLAKLRDDETLLWSVRPEAFEALDKTHKSHFVKKAIAVVVVFAAILAYYIYMAGKTNSEVQIVVILIGVAAAAYGVCSDLLDVRKLKNKTIYGLTDQRMVALIGGNLEAVEYKNIVCYGFAEDEDGHTSFLCGIHAMEAKPFGRRTATICGVRNNVDTALCENFAMYGVSAEVENIQKILSEFIPA